ncbi:MAG TPA: hypothetical protein IAB38_05250 [Candidatus Onthousia excrementipullorum]|uniref:Uncharacterized protein n=1 Tax=Candidatus Onthousia excrementipullorum TaxID=2840884 RepID=A0A9D1J3S0_9FIRM|nr:hypothetical protein [Candidatus Onthousia excrementipullorum]
MEENYNTTANNNSKQVLLSVLGVAILVVAVVGVSFAAFNYSKTGEKVNTITTGTITMSYSENTNGINLVDALPMSDEQGMALSGDNNTFDFTVSATINGSGTTTINYDITATKESSTLEDSAVKVYLTDITSNGDTQVLAPTKVSLLSQTGSSEASGAPSGQYKLASGTFTSSKTLKYRLRMWVADDFSDLGASGTYKLRVNVYGAAAAQ